MPLVACGPTPTLSPTKAPPPLTEVPTEVPLTKVPTTPAVFPTGGVSVGGVKRPFEVVSIDIREREPGIPIHDALAAVEKLILECEVARNVAGGWTMQCLGTLISGVVRRHASMPIGASRL
jgi:hypothetical protein